MNHNSHDEFSQLRAAAAQVEAEALEKVASLKSELETSRFLLDSDRALLLQALDKAQDEAAVAHNAMENMVQHGQLASPQKLASGPLGTHTKTASATQTTVTGPSQAPQPVASNDFLFSTNDCDRHDPLCGNL